MKTRTLIRRSLTHYWRTHLGVVLGAALATLVLTGALLVGDSVKATLRAQAEARVGKIGEALLCGERFVSWPRDIKKRPAVVARMFYPGPDAAGVLLMQGVAAKPDGSARANRVQIVGVDDAFWKLSPSGDDSFAEGRVGFQPAAPGILPGATNVVPGPNVNDADSTRDGPGGTPGPAGKIPTLPGGISIALNARLAGQLGVAAGAEVVLRLEKPGAFSKDAPLSGEEDDVVSLRVRVARVVGDADFGRFALTSGQVPPFTAFVPLAALQEKAGLGEKVNVVLDGGSSAGCGTFSRTPEEAVSNAEAAKKLRRSTIDSLDRMVNGMRQLSDFDIVITETTGGFEIRTPSVFLDPAIVAAARANESGSAGVPPAVPGVSPGTPNVEQTPQRNTPSANERKQTPDASRETHDAAGGTPALPRDTFLAQDAPPPGLDSLTYFVNELRLGDGSNSAAPATPYSMVTAIDAPASGFVQAELADNEIQITRWLADDLGAKPGDKVTIKYFAMGERRQLVEKTRTFTVLAPIIEMDEPRLDASWMPDFPGLAGTENCRDWKPGFDFHPERMRDKDQDYWTKYKGTPKAFINLAVGQEMWGNRWGNLTSIRYPAGTKREQVERIAAFIDPAALGFRVANLRADALAATDAPVDFGQLFVSFSFFLIAAAAVLTGLLFTFSIEQRAAEAGLLLAVGWRRRQVRRLFIKEGALLACIGSLGGAALAALYTKGVLAALAGVWSGATGGTAFVFAPGGATFAIGIASGIVVALLAMWLASRRLFKNEAGALLSGVASAETWGKLPACQSDTAGKGDSRTADTSSEATPNRRLAAGATKVVLFETAFPLVALVAVFVFGMVLPSISPMVFFALGFALLLLGVWWARRILIRASFSTAMQTGSDLALRNTTRRRGRSLATIAVLASGVFMVVAVDSFRKDTAADSTRRDSGTGGFALVGESASPIYEDLNSEKGREQYALDEDVMAGVRVVQMRVRDGDDASCLNLNRAVQPRVIGANFTDLAATAANAGNVQRGRAGVPPAESGILPDSPERLTTHAANSPAPKRDVVRGDADDGGRGRPPYPFSLAWADVSAIDPAAIPGVVDANTLQWALQKKIGDILEIPGERGEPVRIEVAATVPASILQGMVFVPESRFIESFPNEAGYRFFLVDAPPDKAQAVREHLTKQLGDRGLELIPAAQRLAEFNAVENTYLSIFQVLGGLGMLLGSAGLGIVVARNVLERRREFGLLEAVGFTPRQLRALVFAEHRWLIAGALVIGAASALVAVWPQLSQKGGAFPWAQLTLLFGGVAVIGIACAWAATRLALRGSQLGALRTE